MSIFGSIMSKIFGHSAAAAPDAAQTGAQSQTTAVDQAGGSPEQAGSTAAPQQTVDVEAVLNLDSSLEARKELAQELHYSGDSNDSASMNIWLHKQVMQKLAENGGKVPAELKG
jgi:Domain of unknown function (DUF3597)